MCEAPEELDGARVIAFAAVDESVTPTGYTTHRVDGDSLGPAARLAIARYDGDRHFYLLYCDSDWRVLTDTCHATLQQAREQAELEYRGVWAALQPPASEPSAEESE